MSSQCWKSGLSIGGKKSEEMLTNRQTKEAYMKKSVLEDGFDAVEEEEVEVEGAPGPKAGTKSANIDDCCGCDCAGLAGCG